MLMICWDVVEEKVKEKIGNLGGRDFGPRGDCFFPPTLSLSNYAIRSNVVWLRGRWRKGRKVRTGLI